MSVFTTGTDFAQAPVQKENAKVVWITSSETVLLQLVPFINQFELLMKLEGCSNSGSKIS